MSQQQAYANKVIWITGASSGIGKELAIQLAPYHPKLILSARNEAALSEVAILCKELGADTQVVKLDLSDQTSIKNAAETVLNHYSELHYIFHNGGVSSRSLVHETPLEVDRKLMEVNYFGTVSLTKLLLPRFMAQKSGHIVVTSSIAGVFGFPLRSSYSAAKHALHGYFDTLRAELVNFNIGVTIVCPGQIQTNISKHALDKSGKVTGVMDDAQKNGMPVATCVRRILKATYKKKKEVYIGNKEILMVYFKKFIPALYYKLAATVKPN